MEVNPLNEIFKFNSNSQPTFNANSLQYIPNFFEYLFNNSNDDKSSSSEKEKVNAIKNFCNIIKENRTTVEYFYSYEDRSIYLYLFDLYLDKNSSEDLKKEIIELLNELRINIQINKKIFEYLFKNLSSIYGESHIDNDSFFNDNLTLLNSILGETENCIKPKNYLACNGQGKILFEPENDKKIKFGHSLIFILNFFVNFNNVSHKEENICNLITIKLEDEIIQFILNYKDSALMIKDKIITNLPNKEWLNLILFISPSQNQKLELFCFNNGEIKSEKHEMIIDIDLDQNYQIKSIEFFDNFYGEITSISLISQKEENSPLVKSEEFLEFFKNNKIGIWKQKNFNEFIKHISKFKYNDIEINNNPNLKKENSKKINKINQKTESGIIEESEKTLKDDLVFVFSTFNYINTCPNVLDDCLGKTHSLFYGNIRNHKYTTYQNKIDSLFSLANLFPIAEMFLIHPNLLTEKNFELFLKIIENILSYRKHNIKATKNYRFFKILCLFFEKFPKHVFTEKILDGFINIGKTIFQNDSESLCKSYFKYILLNEKILSKYDSNFQIKFWNYIHLFCQSDKTQIGNFINMHRLSLLLRFYDRGKYKEMCCKEHLDTFKEEYMKNKKVMDPPLYKKLFYMKDVINDIIYFIEPLNSFYLFKLMALDLSPCLIKFIVNIFKTALVGHKDDKELKYNFIKVLIKNKYEVILINTFIHSLPDIRLDILELMYHINSNAMDKEQKKYMRQCEMMLKPYILPNEIFYINGDNNNIEEKNEEIKREIIIGKSEKKINEKEKKKRKFIIKEEDKEKSKGILIIKEDIFQNYIDKVISYIILWSLDIQVNINLDIIDLNKSVIKNINILQLLFEVSKKLKDIEFTLRLVNVFDNIFENIKQIEQNCYKALYNNKFMISLIELSFACYINIEDEDKGKQFQKCYNKCKDIIIKIYINSLKIKPNNEKIKFPSDQLEIIFIWCDKILLKEDNRNNKNIIYSFIDEIIFDLLTNFKINFETNMEFNINENDQITTGYFFNNYMIFITKLYQFCFQFRLDTIIHKNGLTIIEQEYKSEVSLPTLFIYTMRIDQNFGNKVNKAWMDFKYIYEIYHRVNFIWQKENIYKKYTKRKKKMKNKFKKYDDIVENIILNKSNKNLYKNELNFLFYQLNENDINIIEPGIKIIQIFMMCMISVYKNKNEDTDFLSWIKEFGKFLRFIIISSSNLVMKDQIEFYEKVQEGSLYAITIGICFLRKCLLTSNTCKSEIEKILIHNFLLCFFIKKFELNYNNNHKKQRIFTSTKFNRNDLSNCAVIMLFNKYFLDENQQDIFNLEYLENILTEEHYYDKIKDLLVNPNLPLEKCLFKNKNLSGLLNEKYFRLNSFKTIVDFRFNEIEKLKDDINYNYSDSLLELLPLYEKELAKYSNNSLEKNLNKKNFYRKFKKSLFSWNGLWSDKSIFYNENITDKILKYKIKNYYTKSLMRPLLVPILDIEYYLPQFSAFDAKKFFNKEPKKIINLDIDQILKSENQKNIELDNNNISDENILRDIYMKSNKKIAEKLKKISDTLDFGKEEEEYNLIEEKGKFTKNKNEKVESKIYFLSCLVTTSHHIKGICFIDKLKINFKVFLNQQTGKSMNGINMSFTDTDEDYDPERKTCYGSYFMFHHKDKNLYKISIKYSDIKYIFRRKYYYKDSALEIFTIDNKSFYFNFKYDFDREIVLQNILKKLGDCNKIVVDLKDTKDSFDNVIGYEHNLNVNYIRKSFFKKNVVGISDKIKLWKKFEISSFELLMWLNIYANRSFNDLSQYPAFPWTLTDFEDPLQKEIIQNNNINDNTNVGGDKMVEPKIEKDYDYRDLSIPIGMLEVNDKCIQRKELFIESYEEIKSQSGEFFEQKPYYFGSNYSNPIYICNFLVRLFPFSNISIELQGNKLDNSDRIFFSVSKTFQMCTSLKTDVRELIPEFFYLPEMFLNINDINLGEKEDGDKVDEVKTPCNNNKYKFIELMKNILENNKISSNLNNWIDLIFGYKSRGKEAEEAKNIFSQYSYQENVNLEKAEDKNLILRYVEFGLIPNQLLSKECPKREKIEDIFKGKEITDLNAKLKVYKCKKTNIKSKDSINEENNKEINQANKNYDLIVNQKTFYNDKILQFNGYTVEEKKINYLLFEKSYSEELLSHFDIDSENMMHYYFKVYKNKDKCSIFCNKGRNLILGGFYDGSIKIINLSKNTIKTNKTFIPFKSKDQVLVLKLDNEEKLLFVGNSIGNINIFSINFENLELDKKFSYNGHLSEISVINVNNELNMWISASIDGIINLYTMPNFKLVRTKKIKSENKIEYAFLSTSTLPSVIVITNDNKNSREILSYSINGKLLEYIKDLNIILNPMIVKDLNFNEYLIYISKDNYNIIIRSLPFLNVHNIISGFERISNLSISEDLKILYAISCEDEQIYVVKDEPK